MPTTPWRAAKWIKSGEATPFWKMGIFCIRMNRDIGDEVQPVVVGIDTGIRKEAYTVKSKTSTYINIQADTIYGIKDKLYSRASARRHRRGRKTPYRKCRYNRASYRKSFIPPSVKARWDFRISMLEKLKSVFPITNIITEDIRAISREGQSKWNKCFSPLQTGKRYGIAKFEQISKLTLISGIDTAKLREQYGLIKSSDKLSDKFEAHCIDSWVMANSILNSTLDNKKIFYLSPIYFFRRRLHFVCFTKGHKRKALGSTRSLGFKRGSIIIHKKYGKCYVGGSSNNRITLCDLSNGERISRDIRIEDCEFVCFNRFKFRYDRC